MAMKRCVRGWVLSVTLVCSWAQAADLPSGVVARVNKADIPQAWLDDAVADGEARGLSDSPQLRASLTDELVVRALLAEQARASKLDRQADVKARLTSAEHSVLAAAALQDYFKKHPITEAELRAEYDAQVALLKRAGPPKEFQLSHIVVSDEAQAAALIQELKSGAEFAQLAKKHSTDASRDQGGDLGWVVPQTILPEIAAVVANVSPGRVAAAPVRTRLGWHVVKVQATRPYVVPTFEDSQAKLRQALLARAWSNHLKELLGQATIQR